MSREAMKLALEALEHVIYWDNEKPEWEYAHAAITALRKALAEQPAQQQNGPINEGWQITVAHGHSGYGVYAHMEDYPEEGAVLVQAIEQPAQRKPLTDEDCTRIYNEANGITTKNPPITTERIFKAMRAAHGIKENT